MLNLNGNLVSPSEPHFSADNRAINYGDAVFETLKFVNGDVLFWEDHYFRLMASMRILRMEIPMSFTLEFLAEEVRKTVEANDGLKSPMRAKILIFRKTGGYYKPEDRNVEYMITVKALAKDAYEMGSNNYVVDLYKDYYLAPGLLSGLKTTNKILNVLGSIYAEENDLHNCLVLNTDKMVVEALNANIFLVKDSKIKTPPLVDGCLKGIMRKQLIEIIQGLDEYELEESSISPFELQKADEIFLTNIIQGIQPVSRYRKKQFSTSVAEEITNLLNEKLQLN